MANIRDIAKLAGVSVATVSRALAKPGVVKDSTIVRVRAAIEQLNYRPNAVASSLRRQRSDTIVVVVPSIHNPFYSGVIQGIENIAHDDGFKILLGESQDEQERLDRYTEMLMSKSAEGLILLGSLLPTVVEESRRRGGPVPIPLVLACERFDGLHCPSVRIDNVAASALATAHLFERGCRRVATITGPLTNSLGDDRLAGYLDAAGRAGQSRDPALIVEGGFTIRSGYEAMAVLLSRRPRPDGVFCASDEMALGALKAIHDAGLAVPGDIAVAGFDNIHFSEYCVPPLSTIAQPSEAIGEAAMRLMLDLLGDAPGEPGSITLPHHLLVRGSSART